MIPLFDLHCDTLEEMYLGNYPIDSSPLHISLDKCKNFSPYIQVMAIWSDSRLTPKEAYLRYKCCVNYAKDQGITFVKDRFIVNSDKTFILAVEDGRIVENDLTRLTEFKDDGVKIITPFWKDTNQLGGAWNTNIGLSDLGIDFIKKCFELSIIPDVSHASVESTKEIIRLAMDYNKTIIASHSNSYTVCSHHRNLRDDDFVSIVKFEGLVGISLANEHLQSDKRSNIRSILSHVYHYLTLGGINTICLGCDFDGVSTLPLEIDNVSDLAKLHSEIKYNFGNEAADKIFFKNALEFFKRNY